MEGVGVVVVGVEEGGLGGLGGSFLMLMGFCTEAKKDDMVLLFFEAGGGGGLDIGVIAFRGSCGFVSADVCVEGVDEGVDGTAGVREARGTRGACGAL